jgi:sulfur relay (sulfurtransferase) DsrF/TusC family protein
VHAIKEVLAPIWKTMPVDAHGHVEIRSLHYLAQRYFTEISSIRLRNFDLQDASISATWDAVELSKRVPGFGELALGHNRFTFEQAIVFVAAVQQIIFDSSSVLEHVIKQQNKTTDGKFSSSELTSILDAYVLYWTWADAFDGSCFHPPGDKTGFCFEVPLKDELEAAVRAQMEALEYRRLRPIGDGRSVLEGSLSFRDAQDISDSITKNFAWFYESDCSQMKRSLVELDSGNTGRVPLSKFYAAGGYFGESEAYLDEQGVLDYTTAREAQVIIPNYMQAASNCIVATEKYYICCASLCERVLQQIEAAVAASEATADEILSVVGNMSDVASVDDEPLQIGEILVQRLDEVAAAHAGKVKLHGRLFSQWLHYVFPQECPFPHRTGTVSSVPVLEYTGSVQVEEEVWMELTAASNATDGGGETVENTDWMSQWTEEEELLAGYSAEAPGPCSFRVMLILGGVLMMLVGGLGWHGKPGQMHARYPSAGRHWV